MPGSLLPQQSLQDNQKRVIYYTFKGFDRSAYKIYAAALVFADEGRGSFEALRGWRGALVLSRVQASQTDFLSFMNREYDGSTPGDVRIGLELSSDTSMAPGVPGTVPNNLNLFGNVFLWKQESSAFIQFYDDDDDEATTMINKFERVLNLHFGQIRETSRSPSRSMRLLPVRPASTTFREIILSECILTVRDLTNVLVWIGTEIDSGGFGEVLKGMLVDEDRRLITVAIKRVKYHDLRAVAQSKCFQNEAGIWSLCQHKNVLKFLGIAHSPTMPACIVSPFMKKGNVRSYLAVNPGTPRIPLIQGTADGIAYLHSQSVIHGDLKGVNILLSDEREPLLCDFGIASLTLDTLRDIDTDSITVLRANSFQWMAKELLMTDTSRIEISKASDVWASAMVAIEILTTRNPYPDLHTIVAILSAVMRGKRPERPNSQECCDSLWSLLNRCWKDEPGDRLRKSVESSIDLRNLRNRPEPLYMLCSARYLE